MNRDRFQAIVSRDGETKRKTFTSFREAFDAIWPAMEATGCGTARGADGRLHDRDFIYLEMAAGVGFRSGGTDWLIVNGYSNAFVEARP